MLNSLWAILTVAIILGFLSGLGTGGGSLLILWLTIVLGYPQNEAKAINLMFFLPAALVACVFRWHRGTLDLKRVLPGIVSGCAAAGICSMFTAGQTPELLRKAFGVLLIYTGIRELLYNKKSR